VYYEWLVWTVAQTTKTMSLLVYGAASATIMLKTEPRASFATQFLCQNP